MNLTTLAKAQSMIRAQEKETGKVSQDQKEKVIRAIERKSAQQAEQALMSLLPEASVSVQQDRKTVINETTCRLSANFSEETLQLLDRVKALLSHKFPQGKLNDLVSHLARYYLNREDPVHHKCQRKIFNEKVFGEKQTDSAAAKRGVIAVPKPLQRVTFKKHVGGCAYVDPVSGRRCGSQYQLQINHIRHRAQGGSNAPGNLNVLCRKHNLLMAEKVLGKTVANQWRR